MQQISGKEARSDFSVLKLIQLWAFLLRPPRMIERQQGLDIDPIPFIAERTRDACVTKVFLHRVRRGSRGEHSRSLERNQAASHGPWPMEARMSYKWSVTFWRICSTREVLQCTDRDDDHPRNGLLGSAAQAAPSCSTQLGESLRRT